MSTLDRIRAKKLIAEKRLSIRKGWTRCKHGIVLRRGDRVIGRCIACEDHIDYMRAAPKPKPSKSDYPSKAMSQDGSMVLESSDPGVI